MDSTGTRRSNLTPLSPLHPNITSSDLKIRSNIEKFQRQTVCGFTTRELQDLDCLTTRYLKPESLVTIHPLLAKDRWETDAEYRARKPKFMRHPGITAWVAADMKIWPRLEPCLKLCSLFLDRIHDNPWVSLLSSVFRVLADSVLSGIQ